MDYRYEIGEIYSNLFKEGLEEEDYPIAFSFNEFDSISSYSGKLRYATQHLKRLGSGSSRVIFQVDNNKVLKVAKNIKGLGQNSVESDRSLQHYGVVAKIFETGEWIKDEGPFWVEMELAKKLTPKRFAQLTGLTHNEVQQYLIWWKSVNNPRSSAFPSTISDDLKLKVEDNEWMQDLMSLIMDYDMEYPGDFGRINSYGEVLREDQPTVVLVDFGLSRGVFYDYYRRN
jgi:hypothetical protein